MDEVKDDLTRAQREMKLVVAEFYTQLGNYILPKLKVKKNTKHFPNNSRRRVN